INAGDGAFYGPKLDFQVTDAIGRPWQLGTVQLDYSQPQNFNLTYIGADNAEHRPVMIHRAILGSLERFIGIVIEHFAGAFPVWLAPVQAVVLPLSEKFVDYANDVARKLRNAQLQKVPYMLVVGEKEASSGTVSLRKRSGGDQGSMPIENFVVEARKQIDVRSLTL